MCFNKVTNVLDIGDGLLCRLLRDVGLNCYVKDKYAQPTYAQGFTDPNVDTPDLVIGFEVLEHYPDPMSDLDQLFALTPRVLLFSTARYTNQTQGGTCHHSLANMSFFTANSDVYHRV